MKIEEMGQKMRDSYDVILRIPFPGIRWSFNKDLLNRIIKDIQKHLLEVDVKWVRYIDSVSIGDLSKNPDIPLDYVTSNFEEANMLIIEKNGKKILDAVKYNHAGKFHVYENNLDKEELIILDRIFKKHVKKTIIDKVSDQDFSKNFLPLFIVLMILSLSVPFTSEFLIDSYGWKTGAIIGLSIYSIFLIIIIWQLWKYYKARKEKYRI